MRFYFKLGGYWGGVIDVYICKGILKKRTCYHIEAKKKWPPFPDDVLKGIFSKENVWIFIKISMKDVLKGQLTIFQHWFI